VLLNHLSCITYPSALHPLRAHSALPSRALRATPPDLSLLTPLHPLRAQLRLSGLLLRLDRGRHGFTDTQIGSLDELEIIRRSTPTAVQYCTHDLASIYVHAGLMPDE
jgi:hypothetical protein